MAKKHKRKEKKRQKMSKERFISLCACIVCHVLIAVSVVSGLFIAEPIKQYDFKLDDVANETIVATRDIEDEYETQRLIEEARNAVADIYVISSSKTGEIYAKVQAGIDYVKYVYDESKSYFESWVTAQLATLQKPEELPQEYPKDSPEYIEYENKLKEFEAEHKRYTEMTYEFVTENAQNFAEVFDATYWNNLINSVNYYYTLDQLKTIAKSSSNDISLIGNYVYTTIQSPVNSGIKQDELNVVVSNIKNNLSNFGFSTQAWDILDTIISQITYNEFLDAAATEQARDLAEEYVKPVVYKKGQIIITAGQRITESQYRLVEQLGLLATGANEYSTYISLAITIIIICAMQCFIFLTYKRTATLGIKNNIIIAVLSIVAMLLYALLKQYNVYVYTSLFSVILIAMLIDSRTAWITSISLSLFTGMYAGGSFTVTVAFVLSCAICACLVNRVTTSRYTVILFGTLAAVVELVVAMVMEYYITAKFDGIWMNMIWILGSGVAASVVSVGALPVFEFIFGVTTPIRMLELSNQNQPLLKRLQMEAPGTYYHSIVVANMAETAAYDIGADSLLARTGAYYHDIGKLIHPKMFKENQADGVNPHDDYPPEVSAKIITSHVREGIVLAEQYRLPKTLHHFVEAHHGSTIVTYFYNTACNNYGKENVNVNDYKYSGKTPETKECAIVMLADTVEAAVRAMDTHNSDEIIAKINALVDGKVDSGQLDNCNLTYKEMKIIKKSFLQILTGAYHQRIVYPGLR